MKIGFPQEERRGNLALSNYGRREVKMFHLQHVLTSHIYVAIVQWIRVVSNTVNIKVCEKKITAAPFSNLIIAIKWRMGEFLLWEFPPLGFSTPQFSTMLKSGNFHSSIFHSGIFHFRYEVILLWARLQIYLIHRIILDEWIQYSL